MAKSFLSNNKSVLRNRNFSLLFAGQLISTFGDNLYSLAFPWFIYISTNSKAALTLSGILVYLPAVAGLFVGVFVDRWNKRWTMVGSDLIRMMIAFLLYVLVYLHAFLWLLFLLVFLIQLIGTVFNPAQTALIPLLVARDDIPSASGIGQSGIAATRLVSNLSGGFLMTLFGAAMLFLWDGVTFAASVVTLLLIKVREPARSLNARTSFFQEWKSGLGYIRRNKSVLRVVITTVLANFALVPTEIVLVAWVKGPLGGKAYILGLTMAAISVGMVVGGLTVKRLSKAFAVRTVLVVGLLSTGICIGLIGLYASRVYVMAMLLVVGFAIGIMNGAIGSFYLLAIDAAFRGRTLSTLRALASLSAPLGTAVYGVLMIQMPMAVVFPLLGLPIAASGFIMARAKSAESKVGGVVGQTLYESD